MSIFVLIWMSFLIGLGGEAWSDIIDHVERRANETNDVLGLCLCNKSLLHSLRREEETSAFVPTGPAEETILLSCSQPMSYLPSSFLFLFASLLSLSPTRPGQSIYYLFSHPVPFLNSCSRRYTAIGRRYISACQKMTRLCDTLIAAPVYSLQTPTHRRS